ncbi:MAG: nicotinate-nucleotide adenylyltransferase [Gemmatimonadota bacterium]|nr:MAG: nicotinate-nucleotide adenylyltransferase [Gemmatimonadota bacterium]
MRIGVFGGSFDPVHIGHLIVAEAAADVVGLRHVRFIPARQQPLKGGHHAAQPRHRAAMLRLALEGNPRFELDLRELQRDGPSYTIDSLRELRNEHPGDQLCFLVGADAVRDLAAWREAAKLAQLAEFVAFARPGIELPDSEIVSRVIEVPAIAVSATDIREAVGLGRSVRYLVPDKVAEYIASHGLYRT